MPHPPKTLAAFTLAAAGLMTLLTPPRAMAQERITLETIGAVRMARFEEVRGPNQELRPTQAAQPAPSRGRVAEHSAKAR